MDRDKILASLRERILAFATLRVARAQAEDLTQEVLVVLHEKYVHVTGLTELVPLAFQIIRFKMLDAHRKSLRRGEYNQESVDDLPLADPGDDPATQLDQRQRVARLLAAMAQLGDRCRELFKWKLEGKSFPRDSKDHGAEFDQHDLHLGPSLPKAVAQPNGRLLGMKVGATGRWPCSQTRTIRLCSSDARSRPLANP